MRKPLLALSICTMMSFCASAQITYLADTAFTTDVGYRGAPASCVYTGGYNLGYWMDKNMGYSLADVITVPFATTWSFDTVILFGYIDSNTVFSPFTAAYLQIYEGGAPGAGGVVVWGDTATNLLVRTGFTGIYRVDTNSSSRGIYNTSLPIMYLKLRLSHIPHLTANNYWLCWSAKASGSGRIYCPPKVLRGRINPSWQQGMQDSSGTWTTLSDDGQRPGFNIIIKTSAAITASVPNVQGQTMPVLSQNTPNPFNGATNISYYLPEAGPVKLLVYNVIGQLVATLADGNMGAGEHNITFNANDLPGGTYYCKLVTSAGAVSRPMVLIK